MKVLIGKTAQGEDGSRPLKPGEFEFLDSYGLLVDRPYTPGDFAIKGDMTLEAVSDLIANWAKTFCPECGKSWEEHHPDKSCVTADEKNLSYFRVLMTLPNQEKFACRVYNASDLMWLKKNRAITGQYWDTISDDEFDMLTIHFKCGTRMTIQKFGPKDL